MFCFMIAHGVAESSALKAALEEAFDGLQQKREVEQETDKVVTELQVYFEVYRCEPLLAQC